MLFQKKTKNKKKHAFVQIQSKAELDSKDPELWTLALKYDCFFFDFRIKFQFLSIVSLFPFIVLSWPETYLEKLWNLSGEKMLQNTRRTLKQMGTLTQNDLSL